MNRLKPLFFAFLGAVVAMILSFALIFGGGLLWDMSQTAHDGQAGMGWFIVAAVVAPVVGLVTFAEVYTWLRRKSANSLQTQDG